MKRGALQKTRIQEHENVLYEITKMSLKLDHKNVLSQDHEKFKSKVHVKSSEVSNLEECCNQDCQEPTYHNHLGPGVKCSLSG